MILRNARKAATAISLDPTIFATIYNVLPLWGATPAVDGTGKASPSWARATSTSTTCRRSFRNLFGLPQNDPQIIVDGPDPGLVSGDETESDLDVEWSGGVAKGGKALSSSPPASWTEHNRRNRSLRLLHH